jgi:hypothetical protein
MTIIASSYTGNAAPEEDFTFQSVSICKKTDDPSKTILDWISQNENIHVEDQAYSVDPEMGVKKIRFSLTGNLAGLFPLLRGIAGSGHPSSIFLDAHTKEKYFILQFDTSSEGKAREYLSKVFKIIEDEFRFKLLLKKVISNQEKFIREEKLLFNELSK